MNIWKYNILMYFCLYWSPIPNSCYIKYAHSCKKSQYNWITVLYYSDYKIYSCWFLSVPTSCEYDTNYKLHYVSV